jgi:hypothetical protein
MVEVGIHPLPLFSLAHISTSVTLPQLTCHKHHPLSGSNPLHWGHAFTFHPLWIHLALQKMLVPCTQFLCSFLQGKTLPYLPQLWSFGVNDCVEKNAEIMLK